MKYIIVLFLYLMISSCDEDSKASYHEINSITITDQSGRIFDGPEVENIKTKHTSGDITQELLVYPNPADKSTVAEITTSEITTIKVWLEPAIFSGSDSTLVNSNLAGFPADTFDITPKYPAGEEIALITGDLPIGTSTLTLDFQNIKPGFFKLYANFNGITLYDNIWIARIK